MRSRTAFWLAVALQALVLAVGFREVLWRGDATVLRGDADAAKNAYALRSYVAQPDSVPLLHYGAMNHPYGDRVFFTDNTPAVSVPLRALARATGWPLERVAIPLFQALVLLQVLLTTGLAYRILERLGGPGAWTVALAVPLFWTGTQAFRVAAHPNLSVAWVLLVPVWAYLRERDAAAAGRPAGRSLPAVVGTVALAAWIHPYLAAMALLEAGLLGAARVVGEAFGRRPAEALRTALGAGAALALAAALSFGLLATLDPDGAARNPHPGGWNTPAFRVSALALVQPPVYHDAWAALVPPRWLPFEGQAFPGTGLWWAALALAALAGRAAWRRRRSVAAGRTVADRARADAGAFRALALTATVGLLCAFGMSLSPDGVERGPDNVLSPLYWGAKISPAVEHFRMVGRFHWVAFWCGGLALLGALLRVRGPARPVVLALALGFLLLDAHYGLRELRRKFRPNPYADAALEALTREREAAGVDASGHAALLALPFYHVGSGDYDHTIDPSQEHANRATAEALSAGLPLLNSMMARTPPAHAHALFTLFEGTPDPGLLRALDGRPVLVFAHAGEYAPDGRFTGEASERQPAGRVEALPLSEALAALPGAPPEPLGGSAHGAWYRWVPPRP